MKKALISLSIFGLTAITAVQAQQSPLSNFYNFNEYLINPAQAGYRNQLEGSASHRIQWQGIDGAPTTTFLGVHGALNEKMGLGVKLNIDQTDILQQFNAAVSYAYRIVINEKAKLNFGVSGMAIQNSINYGDAVIGNYADEVINGGAQDGMTFDAEAGILLEYSKLKVGIASSHLFESGVDYDIPESEETATFERIRQFIAYSSYQFDLNENWTLEPFVLVRNQGVESFQFEVNALSAWKETLYLGAGYRQEAGYIARVGFQITDQLMAAYAYEFSNSGVASYSNGSHEFMLGYNLGKLTDKKAPEVKKELAPEPIVEKVEEKIEEVVEEVKEVPVVEEVKEVVKTVVEEKPKPAPVVETVDKSVFDKDIKFEFETADKDQKALEDNSSLDQIAAFLIANPDKRVRIEGHTCDMGNDAVNTKYSIQRANTAKDYLLAKGVNENQMEIKAMLDTEPLVPNTSIANRQKNRRVEIELID